jgi:hypothetical protein
VGFEPTNRGFADRSKFSILLTRHAFASALLAGFGPCLEGFVPKLFPSYGMNPYSETKISTLRRPSAHSNRTQ